MAANKLPSVNGAKGMQMTGSHWSAVIVNPPQKTVTYKSSLMSNKAAEVALNVSNCFPKHLCEIAFHT